MHCALAQLITAQMEGRSSNVQPNTRLKREGAAGEVERLESAVPSFDADDDARIVPPRIRIKSNPETPKDSHPYCLDIISKRYTYLIVVFLLNLSKSVLYFQV